VQDRSKSLRHLIGLYRTYLREGTDADIAMTYRRRLDVWEGELAAIEIDQGRA
jgi:hypothetical protein